MRPYGQILLVDDDEGLAGIVALTLKRNGHNILPASNGIEALLLYSSYRAKIDLVLTDVDMPQMNGIELADRIRALDPSRRILLMSGRALDSLDCSEKCPTLSKPFLPDQLMSAIDSALGT